MDLKLQQARFQLGQLPGEVLPDVALAMLARGLDSQAVRELAGLDRPTLRDAGALFERALEETGHAPLSAPEARALLLHALLEDIVSGRMDPGAGALELWARAFDFGTEEPWTPFIALASEYEDHPEHRPALAAEIIERARRLLNESRARSV